MRVGVNCLFDAFGGSLKLLQQLLDALKDHSLVDEHQVIFFVSKTTLSRLKVPISSNFVVECIDFPIGGLVGRVLREQVLLPYILWKKKIDTLLCLANTMPFACRVPTTLMILNAAPFFMSASSARVSGFKMATILYLLRISMLMSIDRAKSVIFVSEFLKEHLINHYNLKRTKTTVIYHADNCMSRFPKDTDIETAWGIKKPYILYVSHIYPYKNVLELIESFSILATKYGHNNLQLVIAGNLPNTRYVDRVKALIAKLGYGKDSVILTGLISEYMVASLIRNTMLFVFPSTCENCPTTLIEAMNAGIPIALSNLEPMPEIVRDGGEYFNPYSPEDIASVIHELLTDEGRRLGLQQRAALRGAQFPKPDRMARRVFDEVINNRLKG